MTFHFKATRFEPLYLATARRFLNEGSHDVVDVGEWHAMDVSGNPQLVSRELRNASFDYLMPHTMEAAQADIRPNLPWAEDQFQERVGRVPLNPGETHKSWPWQSKMSEHVDEVFSHTYPERYWPKHSHPQGDSYSEGTITLRGIRYPYGDLDDVVSLLARSPYTRQAVLPVWYPEDTGAVAHQRVPCSLSYQFLLRENRLHCTYTIRSCDFMRHLRDDVYHTIRLTQWILSELQKPELNRINFNEDFWVDVTPGTLTFQCGSLHCFEGDIAKLKREYEQTD